MIYNQLRELCLEKGTTPTEFVTDVLHLSSSKVTAWKNGSIPKFEILQQIANYFNVTVGYLFDGKEKSSSHPDITPHEVKIVKAYREQPEAVQDAIDKMLDVKK